MRDLAERLRDIEVRVATGERTRSMYLKSIEECGRLADHHDQQGTQWSEVRTIIQAVSLITQQEAARRVEYLVNLALQSVFEDVCAFRVIFDDSRANTEITLSLELNGEMVNPMDASGGGVVDVVAFALRVVMWEMSTDRTAPVLIMDEPFRFLSRDLLGRAAIMIKELSRVMGLQFVIVTHSPELAAVADRTFEVDQDVGISSVRILDTDYRSVLK